jgi:hypothetical protein
MPVETIRGSALVLDLMSDITRGLHTAPAFSDSSNRRRRLRGGETREDVFADLFSEPVNPSSDGAALKRSLKQK